MKYVRPLLARAWPQSRRERPKLFAIGRFGLCWPSRARLDQELFEDDIARVPWVQSGPARGLLAKVRCENGTAIYQLERFDPSLAAWEASLMLVQR